MSTGLAEHSLLYCICEYIIVECKWHQGGGETGFFPVACR